MKRHLRFLVSLLIFAGILRAEPPPGYKLQWADEFDGKQLDTKKWTYLWPGENKGGFNVPEAVTVRDGFLTITTYTEAGKHFSGIIGTKGLFESCYGYWEARIKWANAPGTWSAFWSTPPDLGEVIGDVAKVGAEIDIVEHRATDNDMKDVSNVANITMHYDFENKTHKRKKYEEELPGLADGFHLYACEWTNHGYRFFIDDKLVWSVDEPVSKRSQFIILSSEVRDKSWASYIPKEGYGDRATSQVKMVVDYVRCYMKP